MKSVYDKEYDLLVIGESMMELSCDGEIISTSGFEKDIGGADLTVAAAAARLGSKVQLISAIAHDPFHGFMRERLTEQNIDISLVTTCLGYNGLYFTSTKYPEHREYLIHHPGTASRHIAPSLILPEYVENCKIVYASSELQSVSRQTRQAIFKAFYFANTNNIMVAYDTNLRLMRWSLDDAKECLWSVLALIDVIFVSSPEETKALFGYERPIDVIGFLWHRGVDTVVVKTGAGGCTVGHNKTIKVFPPQNTGDAAQLKTPTLVGSAFNGGFLHSIARGCDRFAAADVANSAAAFKGTKGVGLNSLPEAKDLQ